MSVLSALAEAIRSATVDVIDLTAPLSSTTPILKLPEPFGNTVPFTLHEISRYDERGPAWYWNDITTGEHTGTHFDAPVHWVTGRDGQDVSQVPLHQADRARGGARLQPRRPPPTRTSCWRWTTSRSGRASTARCRREAGCCTGPAGTPGRATRSTFLNANETGPHTPGVSVECARWLAQEAPVIGFGVETVGTDAGAAHSFDPPFPCHSSMLGADKYGLTQLQNLALLPAAGAVIIVSPLPITGGSGSPCRALALVERA